MSTPVPCRNGDDHAIYTHAHTHTRTRTHIYIHIYIQRDEPEIKMDIFMSNI